MFLEHSASIETFRIHCLLFQTSTDSLDEDEDFAPVDIDLDSLKHVLNKYEKHRKISMTKLQQHQPQKKIWAFINLLCNLLCIIIWCAIFAYHIVFLILKVKIQNVLMKNISSVYVPYIDLVIDLICKIMKILLCMNGSPKFDVT